MTTRIRLTVGLLALLGIAPASAQSATDCKQAAEPATKPAPASNDGTAPGNAGSTGWSGGLGGSNIGTSQNGSTEASKSVQPATARGLDLKGVAPKSGGC